MLSFRGYRTIRLSQCMLVSCLILLCGAVPAVAGPQASASSWPMRQRDMQNTGRADYSVPPSRLNRHFFDAVRWQSPVPGSPNEGNLSSTQMVFCDQVGRQRLDIVAGTYHAPKGIQGMDRHSGRILWRGATAGGEAIALWSAAFSPDGGTIYVANDATDHPLMAFGSESGPSLYWDNGMDPSDGEAAMGSPKVAPDGRVFAHSWNARPLSWADDGHALARCWAANERSQCLQGGPALSMLGNNLHVISGGDGGVACFDGTNGECLWRARLPGKIANASPTIDPVTGNIYVPAEGNGSVYVIGLTGNGAALWDQSARMAYEYIEQVNAPGYVAASGCLSDDGSTFYFQSASKQGDGKLYAVDTKTGAIRWAYDTHSKSDRGRYSASPIVTRNGVIVVGNNDGGMYFAIKDFGRVPALVATLAVGQGGTAAASASLAPDGSLYLPLRVTWTAAGGGQPPSGRVENLFCCIDLTDNVREALKSPPEAELRAPEMTQSSNAKRPVMAPPAHQSSVALNNAVSIRWDPVTDAKLFDCYAVYRASKPIMDVTGMVPLAVLQSMGTGAYVDGSAVNGSHYYYAVTIRCKGGGEMTAVRSLMPRTPRDETDLQVVSIARTPFYPRYAPIYKRATVVEPSGFGPYFFSIVTGYEQGQNGETQHAPAIGETVTYVATIRNRGTNPVNNIHATWSLGGNVVQQVLLQTTLKSGDTVTASYRSVWDGDSHQIAFTIEDRDIRPRNNVLTIDIRAVGFLTYIDQSMMEDFRERTWLKQVDAAATDDMIDWLNHQMARFNQLFAQAGCGKRVHYDVLEVLPDGYPDPAVQRLNFACFPFRFRAGEDDSRNKSAYYHPADDADIGLLHEMAHQLGMVDTYQFDVGPDNNQVCGQVVKPYLAAPDLMACGPVISPLHTFAMNKWQVHGLYGQYLYNLPATIAMRLMGRDGRPLAAAHVKVYQYCERPGIGRALTNQIKAQGETDSEGRYVLPNVKIDPALVPPLPTGDTLRDNPFGYVDCVGTNGTLLLSVESGGEIDYCWLDLGECVAAYGRGDRSATTFTRPLDLGGPVQPLPPHDLTESSAGEWRITAADKTQPTETFASDDGDRAVAGNSSVRFENRGGGNPILRYPNTARAQWDLTRAISLQITAYAEFANGAFDVNGMPVVRLYDQSGSYAEYCPYANGTRSNLINKAIGRWCTLSIPLAAASTAREGWRRVDSGTVDLSRVSKLEIILRRDPYRAGSYSLWLDDVHFSF
ncbi:MAG: PQQ-binding-like beta-propeller repeat protein [Armatimonadia bacterium]